MYTEDMNGTYNKNALCVNQKTHDLVYGGFTNHSILSWSLQTDKLTLVCSSSYKRQFSYRNKDCIWSEWSQFGFYEEVFGFSTAEVLFVRRLLKERVIMFLYFFLLI